MTPPVRFHNLQAVGRSAAHGKWSLEGNDDDPTYPMEGGKAFHGVVLKGERVLCFDTPRRGKAFEIGRASCRERVSECV